MKSKVPIATKDHVFADCIGARILGIGKVEHITHAQRLNLGKAFLEEIEIIGLPLPEAIEIFNKRSANERLRATAARS